MRGLLALPGALLAALLLASCGAFSDAPDWGEPAPALWEITGPDGEQGWSFGTIHALPDGVEWRTAEFEQAFAASDVLLVEIADLASPDVAATFKNLSQTPGQPPLSSRVDAQERTALAALIDRADMADSDFAQVETWAAALMLASAVREGDPANGVDRALIAKVDTVSGLETASSQLGIFDRLPEADQSDMLALTATADARNDPQAAARAWFTGDLDALDTMVRQPLLATPNLHEALLTRRNAAWTAAIEQRLKTGNRPFIAVGAGHVLGPVGLPALLTAQGYTVTRLQ